MTGCKSSILSGVSAVDLIVLEWLILHVVYKRQRKMQSCEMDQDKTRLWEPGVMSWLSIVRIRWWGGEKSMHCKIWTHFLKGCTQYLVNLHAYHTNHHISRVCWSKLDSNLSFFLCWLMFFKWLPVHLLFACQEPGGSHPLPCVFWKSGYF